VPLAAVGRCYASSAGGFLDVNPDIEGDAAFAGAESAVGRDAICVPESVPESEEGWERTRESSGLRRAAVAPTVSESGFGFRAWRGRALPRTSRAILFMYVANVPALMSMPRFVSMSQISESVRPSCFIRRSGS
jgi:hypothetical protein